VPSAPAGQAFYEGSRTGFRRRLHVQAELARRRPANGSARSRHRVAHGHDHKPRFPPPARSRSRFRRPAKFFFRARSLCGLRSCTPRRLIFREAQTRKQRGRNPASAKKKVAFTKAPQTRSAAASSASTSLAVCAVEMIQCRRWRASCKCLGRADDERSGNIPYPRTGSNRDSRGWPRAQ